MIDETVSTDKPQTEGAATLVLDSFGIAFRTKSVISAIDLRVHGGAPHVLLGPAGAGKSSLLLAVSTVNFQNEATVAGSASLCGERLSPSNHVTLVLPQRGSAWSGSVADGLAPRLLRSVAKGGLPQAARLERAVAELERLGLTSLKDQLAKPLSAVSPAEARTISLVRFAAEAPRMIGLDEPTAGMTQSQLFEYCSVVRALAARIPMLVGTKDALAAREFGGFVSLLAGGRLVEQRPAKDFFRAPRTASAKQYVREGVCPNPPIHAGPDQADARFRLQYPEFFPDASAPTGNEFLRACQSYAPPATTEGPTSVRRWGIDGRRTPTIPYLPSREVADVETMDGGGTARDAD